jgi:hypothetical protein
LCKLGASSISRAAQARGERGRGESFWGATFLCGGDAGIAEWQDLQDYRKEGSKGGTINPAIPSSNPFLQFCNPAILQFTGQP